MEALLTLLQSLSPFLSLASVVIAGLVWWQRKIRFDEATWDTEFERRCQPRRTQVLESARSLDKDLQVQMYEMQVQISTLAKEVAEMRGELRSMSKALDGIQQAINRKGI